MIWIIIGMAVAVAVYLGLGVYFAVFDDSIPYLTDEEFQELHDRRDIPQEWWEQNED